MKLLAISSISDVVRTHVKRYRRLGVNLFVNCTPVKLKSENKNRAWGHQRKEKVVYRSGLLQELNLLFGVAQN